MKKRSYWVLLGVIVLVGACLLVYLSSQNQLPVVQDVNAQDFPQYPGPWQDQNTEPWQYRLQPYRPMMQMETMRCVPSDTFKPACFGGGSYPTFSTCEWNCGGSVVLGGSSGNTQLFCPTSMNCGSQTSLNCTALACGGGTSGICGSGTYAFCLGGETTGICGAFFKLLGGGMGYNIPEGYSLGIYSPASHKLDRYQTMDLACRGIVCYCAGTTSGLPGRFPGSISQYGGLGDLFGMGSLTGNLGAMYSLSATPHF